MSLDSICVCKNKATPTYGHLECNGPLGSSSTCSAWSTSADPIIVLIGRAIDARQTEVKTVMRLSRSGKPIYCISSPVQNHQSAIETPQTNSTAPKLLSFKVDNDSDSEISDGSWNLYRRPLQKPTNMLPCQLLVWLWPNSATHRLAHLWHNSISTRLFAKSQPSYWRTSKPNAWSSEKFWLHVGWICTNFTYWHKLNFLDCLLSGRDWTSMICHKVQKTCSWLYGGKVTPSKTKLTLPNSNSTVEKGTLKFLSLV